MKTKFFTPLAVVLSTVSVPAAAQVSLEANVAHSEDLWGGELGVGYSIISLGGFRITPAGGVFIYQGDNDRYSFDNNGGNPRCRDSTNGQYAADELCNNTAIEPYARLEATYTLPAASVTVGAGVRYMVDEFRPYGTIALPLAPLISLKGNAGQDYYAAGLMARF